MVRLSTIKWGEGYRLRILGVVTYVLVVARTGTPTVPTALGVPYGYAPAVTRVLGPTIAMGYDSQIVTSGGGVTRQTAEEGVGQVT